MPFCVSDPLQELIPLNEKEKLKFACEITRDSVHHLVNGHILLLFSRLHGMNQAQNWAM